MKQPAPELVRDLVVDLTSHVGATVVDKRTALEMLVAARVLRGLGAVCCDHRLNHYASTIGRRIYLPFEIGTPVDGFDLWGQSVAVAHASQRVVQHAHLGSLRAARARLDRGWRSELAREALRTVLELHFWRTAEIPSPLELAMAVRTYATNDADLDLAAEAIDECGAAIEVRVVATAAGRFTVDWLAEHAPELGAGR